MIIKGMWQKHVMEAGYLTNFILNITAPNSKHFTHYQLNKGPPSAGQITWLHHFQSQVQVFFSAFKNSFNIGIWWRTNIPIPIYISSGPSADWVWITFSPQINHTRVCLEAYWDRLFNQVLFRLFGPLLVLTRVQLLHSHLHKQTASNGGNALRFDLNKLNKAGVKAP